MFLTLATADVHNLTKVNEGGYHVIAADMQSHWLAPTSIRGKVECGLFCLQSAACAGFTHLHNTADNNNCILYDNLANITSNNISNINNHVDNENSKSTNDNAFSVRFDVSNILSVEEGLFDADWRVFPNPSTDQVTVMKEASSSKGQLKLLSLTGQQLNSWETPSGKTTVNIDVSFLPAGVYVLQWTDDHRSRSTKLLKQWVNPTAACPGCYCLDAWPCYAALVTVNRGFRYMEEPTETYFPSIPTPTTIGYTSPAPTPKWAAIPHFA